MTVFIVERTIDAIMYNPIIDILHKRKNPYNEIYISGVSMRGLSIAFDTNIDTIQNVVMYGASRRKLEVALLCKEYEIPLILLHNDERLLTHDSDPELSSYQLAITSLSTSNFVHKHTAIQRLQDEGIQTPISLFECPITLAARNSKQTSKRGIVLAFQDSKLMRTLESELKRNKVELSSFDLSGNTVESMNAIYGKLQEAKFIVSDIFAFDRVARNLNKHLFFYGSEIYDTSNLGKSTHCIPNKKELHSYINKEWSELEDQNPRIGIHSLINLLSQ